MTEVRIYHLQRQSLDGVLPTLLLRSRARGWRALVKVATDERLAALDERLWTFADESFLPHGTDREPDAAGQPILLTTADANPNGAAILFLADGAGVPADVAGYEVVAILLDGADTEAVAAARADWRRAQAAGHAVAYWQQDEAGRWAKRA